MCYLLHNCSKALHQFIGYVTYILVVFYYVCTKHYCISVPHTTVHLCTHTTVHLYHTLLYICATHYCTSVQHTTIHMCHTPHCCTSALHRRIFRGPYSPFGRWQPLLRLFHFIFLYCTSVPHTTVHIHACYSLYNCSKTLSQFISNVTNILVVLNVHLCQSEYGAPHTGSLLYRQVVQQAQQVHHFSSL